MILKFTKMHSCGNDYIYIDCFNLKINNHKSLSIKLSDRNFGVGGDGVIFIYKSDIADAKMRMFNADGSEGKMCGNGIRCVGKYLYDKNLIDITKNRVNIETLSGVKNLEVYKDNEEVTNIRVNMGSPEFIPDLIPVKLNVQKILNKEIKVDGKTYYINCVSMGNPHCVIFYDNIKNLNLEYIGPIFENLDIFPDKSNIEFVKILDHYTIEMRVWERGSGETLSCGTGACAAVVLGVENGFLKSDTDITVKLKGGDLKIKYINKVVYITGNAQKVYEGVIEI